ncbi:autotransporter outer membrane beta-barrel domain-containing protein [Phascolarctobacterium succinatutens]|uniref:autotransporter outer membrane beta-barrel domain-containing protein n=1 Tax=Phascolarctobacterium succinatutens TaxID=626940 RepID=UPI003FD7975C
MKSSKALARKILCGLLAAGVVGVSGSALAATACYLNKGSEANVNVIGKYDVGIYVSGDNAISFNGESINLDITPNKADMNNVGVDASVALSGRAIVNLGKKDVTKNIDINVLDNSGNKDFTALGMLAYGSPDRNGGLINVNGKNLNLKVASTDSFAYGIIAQNTTTDAKNFKRAEININTDNTYIEVKGSKKGEASGIVAMSQGIVNINSNLEVHADNAITTRGDSLININTDGKHTTKLFGDINFNYDEATSGTKVDADLNVNLTGADSLWNGNAVVEWGLKNGSTSSYEDLKNDGKLKVETFNLNIADDAQWNPTTIKSQNNETNGVENIAINNLALNNGIINLDSSNLAGDDAVNIENLQGNGGTINTDSVSNKLSIENKAADTSLTVNGTKEVTDAIASGKASLQKLADVVKSNGKSAADTVTSDANDIIGGYSAKVGDDGKVVAKTVKTLENPTNRAISDMANISLMTWRQENNDMNKRLGELRDSKGEHGAWVRMARGESKYGSQNVKNQYNYYQVGYDEKLSTNTNWTVGVALTRTEGTSTFARGTGENKHTGFAVYGSYLNDNGSFVDLIAKYARMDNDYSTIGAGVGDASYETNGYSLSAEYGKRFTKDNGFWIEPQVELTYGTVGSVDYLTSKGARVHQDSVDSLVGRLGISLGKDIKQGNVYVRASYLYDFDGETKATMSGAGTASFEQDLGGGWWEVGVGTNLNLSDATHLYFDVEKTYGGNVATPWQWNAGVRWSF